MLSKPDHINRETDLVDTNHFAPFIPKLSSYNEVLVQLLSSVIFLVIYQCGHISLCDGKGICNS